MLAAKLVIFYDAESYGVMKLIQFFAVKCLKFTRMTVLSQLCHEVKLLANPNFITNVIAIATNFPSW